MGMAQWHSIMTYCVTGKHSGLLLDRDGGIMTHCLTGMEAYWPIAWQGWHALCRHAFWPLLVPPKNINVVPCVDADMPSDPTWCIRRLEWRGFGWSKHLRYNYCEVWNMSIEMVWGLRFRDDGKWESWSTWRHDSDDCTALPDGTNWKMVAKAVGAPHSATAMIAWHSESRHCILRGRSRTIVHMVNNETQSCAWWTMRNDCKCSKIRPWNDKWVECRLEILHEPNLSLEW